MRPRLTARSEQPQFKHISKTAARPLFRNHRKVITAFGVAVFLLACVTVFSLNEVRDAGTPGGPFGDIKAAEPRANLLFMSVGDNGAFRDQTVPPFLATSPPDQRTFDVFCVYYHQDREMWRFLRRVCDFVFSPPLVDSDGRFHAVKYPMQGHDWWTPPSKCQTFYRLWHAVETEVPQLLRSYASVALWDDDAILERGKLDALFEASNRFDFSVVTASFDHGDDARAGYPPLWYDPKGQTQHVRAVGFIEMNFPVFKAAALRQLMDQHYDDGLVAWGFDILYSCMWPKSLAVVNHVTVKNLKHGFNRDIVKVYKGKLPDGSNWSNWAQHKGLWHCDGTVFAVAKSYPVHKVVY